MNLALLRPPASTIVLALCISLLLPPGRLSAGPRRSSLVAGYSTTSLRNMPWGRSHTHICRRRPVFRMQLGGGMGGGPNGFNNNGQSNSFGATSGGMGQGGGMMGPGGMGGGTNGFNNNGQSNSVGAMGGGMGQRSGMMGQGGMGGGMGQGSGMMGQGNSNMMGQGNNNMAGQGQSNNNMRGSGGNNYYDYDQSNPRRPVELRYNQPSGSSVSDSDFVKNNGYQNGYRDEWQGGLNSETHRRRRATLRDAGRNRSPTSNLGYMADQYLQRSAREIDRYAYDDYANAPSMPDEREWSRQQQYQQQNDYYGGTSDYSRAFSSDVRGDGYGRGGYGGSDGGWGFRSASLSGLSRELRAREMEDIRESRRMGGSRRYRDGDYYGAHDGDYYGDDSRRGGPYNDERGQYGRAQPSRGSRRRGDFDDGAGGFAGGYSSGRGGQYSDGDGYNEEYY